MTRWLPASLFSAAVIGASSAGAQPAAALVAAPPTGRMAAAEARLSGYLPRGQAPDAAVFIPPAPQPGSALEAADLDTWRRTRALEGSARWRIAAADAVLAPAAIMADFACALGVRLDPATAPSLARLITRAGQDGGGAAGRAKAIYKRPRPFVTQGGAMCLPEQRASLTQSWSYPSGHATYGWVVGLLLSELAPDRGPALLARGRAYGDSRVVCGVHYPSDVEQGRNVASGVIAVLHSDPSFRADLDLARAEVAVARARGGAPETGQCRVEAETLAMAPVTATR